LTPALQTVKPDTILHELSELWIGMTRPEPEESADGNSSGILRACAMTLIVFVDDEEDSKALGETLIRIMRTHPNRTILVRLRESPGSLESRVFAPCWTPTGHQRQICCEQVELSVSMNRLTDIPAIVLPLEAPDVPRVIWFRSARIDTAADIAELLALGDKIIVDSARPGSPAFADMRVLAGAGYIVADLAWTRLTRIRELLAQLLDGRDLADIRTATIEYSGSEPSPEVKYMQAWLRSEMPGAVVDVRRADGVGHGEISAIHIDPSLHVNVASNCADYETGSLRQRANLGECEERDLLSEELSIMTHDPVFGRALQRMTAWTPRS